MKFYSDWNTVHAWPLVSGVVPRSAFSRSPRILRVITRCIIFILKAREREAESDRFGLPAHPRSAAPKIAINFSSATEFSSWEGRHSDDAVRARSETAWSSSSLPSSLPSSSSLFLLAVRTRSWRVAFVARVHYFYSLSLRICSRGALARALVSKVTAFRRAGELSVCHAWTQERRRCVYHFHLCVYSSQIESAVLCNNSFSLPAAPFTHSALAMHTRGMDWMKGHQSDRH